MTVMKQAVVTVKGVSPLLQNNPVLVDRFNPIARRMKTINDKKTRRTDDDYLELRDLEMEAKVYFQEGKVVVPTSWVMASLATSAFKVAKISRDSIRGAVFMMTDTVPLTYQGMENVKGIEDIVKNPEFRHMMTLPQAQGRVVKAFPIFKKWSFTTEIEFDAKIIDPESVTKIFEHAARYVGYGDFRPTFGRATVEVDHV
jgi:hypothetical protein